VSTADISVRDYGGQVFFLTRSSGSLVLAGACRTSPDGDVIATDQIRIFAPQASNSPDEALDDLVHAYTHVRWSRQLDGLVQVRDDRASASILGVSIRRLELKDVVDLQDGLRKVLLAPEIKSFLDRNHLEMPTVFSSSDLWNEKVSHHLSESPTAPKYSRILTNVTLEQALNSLVRVFPGVWIYSECPGRIAIAADLTGAPRWEKVKSESNK
jgi:hypothetical protein